MAFATHSKGAFYRTIPILFLTGLILTLLTAWINIGIIAVDDYAEGISLMIPAQHQKSLLEIANASLHPPVPKVILAVLGRVAHGLGLDEPANQLRFALVFLGLFSFGMNFGFALRHFKAPGSGMFSKHTIVSSLIALYFVCPLFMTRTLIESLSMPYLTASSFFACDYYRRGKGTSLAWAAVLLTLASLMRFQSGVCALALGFLVLVRWKAKDALILLFMGLSCFLVSGWVDWLLRGGFHSSLRGYVDYNLTHASENHGKMPFHTFFVLFVALSIPPTFFLRYRGFNWRKEYGSLLPCLLYFLLFLLSHSLIPHKEDRFMIPVLPLFLILLTPLLHYLVAEGKKWRLVYFGAVNVVLLFFTCIHTPQNNIIGLALYVQRHPRIAMVKSVGDTLVIFPHAFITRGVLVETVGSSYLEKEHVSCGAVVVAREDLIAQVWSARFKKTAVFRPGLLEYLLVKANPKHNARRGAIELFVSSEC